MASASAAAASGDQEEIYQKIEENKGKIEELRKRFADENPQDGADSPFDPRDLEWISTCDAYMYHVLLISQMNLDTAMVKLDKILRWRKDFGVNDLTFDIFPEEIQQKGALYPRGKDNKGRRILWYFIKHYHKDPESQLQAKKMTAYWLNKMQKEDAAHRIVIMEDMSGAGVSNMDIELVKYNIQCFELYFPALVDMLYIYNMPWILNTIWRIIEKLLSQEARNHIKFIRGKEIQTYFDVEALPLHMEGTDSYVWEYIPDQYEEFEDGEENDGDISFRSTDGDNDRSLLPLVNAAKSLRQPKQPKRVHFQDEVDGKENIDPEHSAHPKKHKKHVSHRKGRSKEIHVGPLVTIRPGEFLVFEPPTSISGTEGISAGLNILNSTDKKVVYKVKTTTPERYKVRPSTGPINPGSSIHITITLLSGPGGSVVRDKFLIMSSEPGDASFRTANEMTQFWKNVKPDEMVEHRMSCVFSPSKAAKADAPDQMERNVMSVLSKLKSMEEQIAELRRQNTKLVWLQVLIFVFSAIVLVYLVFFRPDEGALLAHNHSLYPAQCAPCADATEKFLRGAREGL